MAYKISRDLSKRGLTMISGGARGIDTVAHTAVLDTGGRTIAVLGSGLDVPYPYENRKMLDTIAENGAVISEFIPGTKPDAWRFPVRNRIVSGMSLGVLVVESLLTGGAMITANVALEQGRDVWAIPGTTDTPASQGPHRLIKDGAKLIECVEDILEELGIDKDTSGKQESVKLPDNLSSEQKILVMALSLHPKHIDEIISECSLSPASASSNLTLLEMLGLVRRVPGNSYVRVV
jgi:DNA processing protein